MHTKIDKMIYCILIVVINWHVKFLLSYTDLINTDQMKKRFHVESQFYDLWNIFVNEEGMKKIK